MNYALVQRTLGQTLRREAMEEASRRVPAVGIADCARLHRDLFGIVVRSLDEANALAFQGALSACGMDTELVPDSDLPRLVPARRGQGLHFEDHSLVETDLYGRSHTHPMSAWVFAAAGWISLSKQRRETEWSFSDPSYAPSRGRISLRPTTRTRWEQETVFRFDFFFAREPMRMEWVVRPMGGMTLDGRLVRLRDTDALEALLDTIQSRLPSGHMNRGVRGGVAEESPVYPNLGAYEEEIVWHFYQLRKRRSRTPSS